jgi:acetyl-CoA acyltransferase
VAEAYLVDGVRTPFGKGKPGGALAGLHPVGLLAQVIDALITRNGVPSGEIDDVLAGCVAQAGEQAKNIARNAVLAAGWPVSVPGTTIDRQCGSSQQAVHFAAQGVLAGAYDLVIACGVESMSRMPMRMALLDQDPYGPAVADRFAGGLIPQGISAELVADRWKLSREELDEYALASHRRATDAQASGRLTRELTPVTVPGPDGSPVVVGRDQLPRPDTTRNRLADLQPAFRTDSWSGRYPGLDWKVTAGNSSPLSDGAAAVLIASERAVRRYGLTPRARLHAFAVTGDDPVLMLTAVIPATEAALRRAGLRLADIDAFEVNEAFAAVPLAWLRETGADPDRLNAAGGAIAIGHPLGASGARLLISLLTSLEEQRGRFGLQTMCEAGGLANAAIIERLG